jgi:hypothetical protein
MGRYPGVSLLADSSLRPPATNDRALRAAELAAALKGTQLDHLDHTGGYPVDMVELVDLVDLIAPAEQTTRVIGH